MINNFKESFFLNLIFEILSNAYAYSYINELAKPHIRSGWPISDRQENKAAKRHLLVDSRGAPLSLVVTGANRHDVSQLELVLDGIIIEHPQDIEQHLCADKRIRRPTGIGVDRLEALHTSLEKTRRRASGKKEESWMGSTRCWTVEVSHSWFNRFRKILVCYEKLKDTYLAMLQMAAVILAHR